MRESKRGASEPVGPERQKRKRTTEVVLFLVKQNLVLFFHLRAQQVTNSGRTSAFSDFRLATQALDRFFLVFNVLGFHGQLNNARLAVDADDLGFDFFAFFQHIARLQRGHG